MSVTVSDLPAGKSPASRMMGVVVSPVETFSDIARQPGWLFPFVCYLAVFVVCFGIYAWKADWVAIITDQIENNPLMGLMPDAQRDRIVEQSTQEFRKMSQGELTAHNVLQILPFLTPTAHLMTLVFASLFVMMGALKDLKLGKAWLNFLLCLLMLVGYLIVTGVAGFAFRDAIQSRLMLTGVAGLALVGGWMWMLNAYARRDPEFHRMLSVWSYACVVNMVMMIALLVASIAHEPPLQVSFDRMIPSSIGQVVRPDAPVLRTLLERLDLFVIWFWSLACIGYRAVTRLSTGATAAITFLPWGIYVMIRLAIAAAFG